MNLKHDMHFSKHLCCLQSFKWLLDDFFRCTREGKVKREICEDKTLGNTFVNLREDYKCNTVYSILLSY